MTEDNNLGELKAEKFIEELKNNSKELLNLKGKDRRSKLYDYEDIMVKDNEELDSKGRKDYFEALDKYFNKLAEDTGMDDGEVLEICGVLNNENKRIYQNSLLRCFFKYDKNKENFDANVENIKKIFKEAWLSQRSSIQDMREGWSGDLMEANYSLTTFIREGSAFPGDSGCPSSQRAQIYDVRIGDTSGNYQYLSVILNGPVDEAISEDEKEYCKEVIPRLEELDFAPKNNYLDQGEKVHSTYRNKLWLDQFIRTSLMDILPKKE